MSKRFLRNNINTALNHSQNSSSDEDLFHEDLPNLKEILIRNGYPEYIIDQKFLKVEIFKSTKLIFYVNPKSMKSLRSWSPYVLVTPALKLKFM
jgi:hypothetical protein